MGCVEYQARRVDTLLGPNNRKRRTNSLTRILIACTGEWGSYTINSLFRIWGVESLVGGNSRPLYRTKNKIKQTTDPSQRLTHAQAMSSVDTRGGIGTIPHENLVERAENKSSFITLLKRSNVTFSECLPRKWA